MSLSILCYNVITPWRRDERIGLPLAYYAKAYVGIGAIGLNPSREPGEYSCSMSDGALLHAGNIERASSIEHS